MDTSLVPSLEQVRAIAASGDYRRIPVKRELMADRITVVEAFRALSTESSHCFMLESAEPDQHTGRYSFLGFDPTLEVSCTNGHLRIVRDVDRREARTPALSCC